MIQNRRLFIKWDTEVGRSYKTCFLQLVSGLSDKLNLVMVVWLKLEPIFVTAPAAKKTWHASKVVKSDSKIIVALCHSKSLRHSVVI